MRHAGYVAGGRSSRMGCDKALLPFAAARLWNPWRAPFGSAAGNPQDTWLPGVPTTRPARFADHTSADWNLVAACDMPELSAEFLRLLVTPPGDAVVPGTVRPPRTAVRVYHSRRAPCWSAPSAAAAAP